MGGLSLFLAVSLDGGCTSVPSHTPSYSSEAAAQLGSVWKCCSSTCPARCVGAVGRPSLAWLDVGVCGAFLWAEVGIRVVK